MPQPNISSSVCQLFSQRNERLSQTSETAHHAAPASSKPSCLIAQPFQGCVATCGVGKPASETMVVSLTGRSAPIAPSWQLVRIVVVLLVASCTPFVAADEVRRWRVCSKLLTGSRGHMFKRIEQPQPCTASHPHKHRCPSHAARAAISTSQSSECGPADWLQLIFSKYIFQCVHPCEALSQLLYQCREVAHVTPSAACPGTSNAASSGPTVPQVGSALWNVLVPLHRF